MARRLETDLPPLTGADVPRSQPASEAGDPEGLLNAVKRRRKAAAPPASLDPVHADAPAPGGSALDGVRAGRRVRPWTAVAVLATATLLIGSLIALGRSPDPLPVSAIQVSWLPGPQVSQAQVIQWLRSCPQYEKLNEPNDWVLGKLADHLRDQPAVAEVRQIRLSHVPANLQAVRRAPGKPPQAVQVAGIRRTVEVQLALRQPYLPAVLRDGSRAWIDGQGVVLPGYLPPPGGGNRPLVRGVEYGGREGVAAAVDMWQRLEGSLEPGLVSDIVIGEVLDPPANNAQAPANAPRGIVMHTRHGARLVWGRPGDDRYGVTAEEKARELVHTLRCQGDLARLATINVRFHEPFFMVR